MYSVSEEKFGEMMEEALHDIPSPFKEKIENLAFMALPYPSESDLGRVGLDDKYSLLGIYSGVPYTHRNTYYMNTTPDRIILFQKNIERFCDNEAELKEKIREVLIHEIAHYFGMDEDQVRAAGY
ncbi:MAG: metallopeptidase family protein [Ignavibacteria bacterium]|nr:metallopeptidase family protein [Ignavibacteria bacterium]